MPTQPFPVSADRYRDFRERIFDLGGVREISPAEKARLDSIPELEIQARWFGGEFGRQFSTPEGEPVEIVQFGHWNHGPGPDFTDTAVRIGGEVRTGAIEIDLEVESWEAHGHGANPEFNDVVLHVYLRAGEGRFFTRTENHREVSQIQIDLKLLADSRPVPLNIPEARLGRCFTPLASLTAEKVDSLLTAAAQFRLQQKARRLQKIGETHTPDQALFQAIGEALGFRHNKVTMAVLAQRLPISRLRNRPSIEREALLFGAGGFIGHEQFEATEDPDSRVYLKGLWDHWWKLRSEFEPDPACALEWKLAGTRPTNHPQRRLGALAALLDSWPTFAKTVFDIESDDWEKRAYDQLVDLEHNFWNFHYTLKSKPSPKPLVLVGKDRARDILGNLLFPLAVVNSPERNWARYAKLPAVDSNESLRRAILRLFGEESARGKSFSKRYYQQQALLQIYSDFCLEDASECADCPFPEQLAQWA